MHSSNLGSHQWGERAAGKARKPTEVTVPGICTAASELYPSNAYSPIEVTELHRGERGASEEGTVAAGGDRCIAHFPRGDLPAC